MADQNEKLREVKAIDKMNEEELRKEVLRVRQENAELRQNQQQQQQSLQALAQQLQVAGMREEAHLAAINGLSKADKLADANNTRFEAVSKDVQSFAQATNTLLMKVDELAQLIVSLKETAQ